MSNIIRIVTAILDTRNLTLYKEDGTTVLIPQGDARIRPILEAAKVLNQGQSFVDVDISKVVDNQFAEFEKKSSGLIKLFRVAKEALKGLFNDPDPLQPMQFGDTPVTNTNMGKALEEIMANAVPVQHQDYDEDKVYQQGNVVEADGDTSQVPTNHDETHSHTVIAVVDNKIIPGVENIKSQFARAAQMGSTEGVERFLQRIAAVIDKRKHSIDDLLKFMERGDMPIANDGSIIIYKILNKQADGKYRDCHSGNVPQWVGAYVCMDESLVDHDRRNECSNGLHVARRGYLNRFSGNVCVLAKLAPEDVIAVPEYDANKMRVCGYHIIKELPQHLFQLLKQNRPITEHQEGKTILAMAINGQHTFRLDEVRITGQRGAGIQTKKLEEEKEVIVPTVLVKEVEALANPEKEMSAPVVSPNQLNEEVKQMTRKEQAKALWNDYIAQDNFPSARHEALEKLVAYKKSCKCSWEALGLTDPTTTAKPVSKKKSKKSKVKPANKAKATSPLKGTKVPADYEGPKDRIAKLLSIGLTADGVAQKVYNIKREAKKSWEALDVPQDVVDAIMEILNKGK